MRETMNSNKGDFESSFADGLDLSELVTRTRTQEALGESVDHSAAVVSPKQQAARIPSASEQLLRAKRIELQERELREQDARQLQSALMEQVTAREMKQLQRQMESTSTPFGDTMLGSTRKASSLLAEKSPRTLDASLSAILGCMHTSDNNGAMRESKKRERRPENGFRTNGFKSNNKDCDDDVRMGDLPTSGIILGANNSTASKRSNPVNTPRNSPCASYRFVGQTKNEHDCKIELSKLRQRILERGIGNPTGLYKKHQSARRRNCGSGGNSKSIHVVRKSPSRTKH